ncbi:hypothetical protein [Snodgrassella alvi]|uniref:hypothetical protein n=1 Tax=Snodgrassella alvi TaxID=1196083 RepID=UPI000C1F924A|nr:hypothetical protein [Snodgrassella alvi]PIT13244.1 hypothetical protein BGI33_11295 [Snodgrassella alvi]PIT18760.1 hypothetical protein BGI34_04270 [Snodgrassella alvi]
MKWLFAILVALNIIVFGSMIAGKLVHGVSASPAAASAASPAAEVVEAAAPATPDISVRHTTEAAETAASSSVPATKPASKTDTAAANKPKTDTPTDAPANADKPATPTSIPTTNTCTATVTLPEDDFHRIKGLLNHWPFTTSRFIEQVSSSAKPHRVPTPTRYMVALSSSGDSDIRARLQEHGFDYGINQGKVSLGVFNRRDDAESLMARAKMQGFSDAFITTLGGSSSDSDSESDSHSGHAPISIAKMRVVFSGVDNSAMHDINAITGRYGRMQRSGNCH